MGRTAIDDHFLQFQRKAEEAPVHLDHGANRSPSASVKLVDHPCAQHHHGRLSHVAPDTRGVIHIAEQRFG